MQNLTIYDRIRATVIATLPDSRILLFGSRARGDYGLHSDYDLLIITSKTYSQEEKKHWIKTLDTAIVKNVRIPVDLLFNSEEEVCEKRELPGHIIRTVLKEGIDI